MHHRHIELDHRNSTTACHQSPWPQPPNASTEQLQQSDIALYRLCYWTAVMGAGEKYVAQKCYCMLRPAAVSRVDYRHGICRDEMSDQSSRIGFKNAVIVFWQLQFSLYRHTAKKFAFGAKSVDPRCACRVENSLHRINTRYCNATWHHVVICRRVRAAVDFITLDWSSQPRISSCICIAFSDLHTAPNAPISSAPLLLLFAFQAAKTTPSCNVTAVGGVLAGSSLMYIH
jgi:hypothetical protein